MHSSGRALGICVHACVYVPGHYNKNVRLDQVFLFAIALMGLSVVLGI